MILFHRIENKKWTGNCNTPEEVEKALQGIEIVTFDGVYTSVYHQRELLRYAKARVILFVMGDYMGKDNFFDSGEPLTNFCTWEQIFELKMDYGCEIGWHTWSHRNLCELDDQEVIGELKTPFQMDHFAYPYGNVDDRVEALVKESGFNQAWSVDQGNGSTFQQKRRYWA